jgi:hypothetical protein
MRITDDTLERVLIDFKHGQYIGVDDYMDEYLDTPLLRKMEYDIILELDGVMYEVIHLPVRRRFYEAVAAPHGSWLKDMYTKVYSRACVVRDGPRTGDLES